MTFLPLLILIFAGIEYVETIPDRRRGVTVSYQPPSFEGIKIIMIWLLGMLAIHAVISLLPVMLSFEAGWRLRRRRDLGKPDG